MGTPKGRDEKDFKSQSEALEDYSRYSEYKCGQLNESQIDSLLRFLRSQWRWEWLLGGFMLKQAIIEAEKPTHPLHCLFDWSDCSGQGFRRRVVEFGQILAALVHLQKNQYGEMIATPVVRLWGEWGEVGGTERCEKWTPPYYGWD